MNKPSKDMEDNMNDDSTSAALEEQDVLRTRTSHDESNDESKDQVNSEDSSKEIEHEQIENEAEVEGPYVIADEGQSEAAVAASATAAAASAGNPTLLARLQRLELEAVKSNRAMRSLQQPSRDTGTVPTIQQQVNVSSNTHQSNRQREAKVKQNLKRLEQDVAKSNVATAAAAAAAATKASTQRHKHEDPPIEEETNHRETEQILQDIMPLPTSSSTIVQESSCEMIQFLKGLQPEDREYLEQSTLRASQRGEGNPGAYATLDPSYNNMNAAHNHNRIIPDSDNGNSNDDMEPINANTGGIRRGSQRQGRHYDDEEETAGNEVGLVQARAVNDVSTEIAIATLEPSSSLSSPSQRNHVSLEIPEEDDADRNYFFLKQSNWGRQQRRLVSALCFLIIVGLGLTPVVLILRKKNSGNPTKERAHFGKESNTTATILPNMSKILSLPDFTWNVIINDNNSSQALAYKWLSQDPHLAELSEPQKLQRMALTTLYYATTGPKWTIQQDWLNYDTHECHWFSKLELNFSSPSDYFFSNQVFTDYSLGQDLCNNDGQYISLVLPSNELQGPLPPEVSLLTHLELIDLTNNPLQGSLPTEWGMIQSLKGLFLGATGYALNSLTGTIPTSLGLLTNLEYFWTFGADFTGTLPSELGNWQHIRQFTIMASSISGTIPTELYQWTNLHHFGFADNTLTGTIGSEIGRLKGFDFMGTEYHFLTWVLQDDATLSSNNSSSSSGLSGSLQTELGLMTDLRDLYFGVQTDLSGTIPSEIGLCQELVTLRLGSQRLSGTVPPELFDISSLESLILTGNPNLTGGSIPSQLGLATNLQWLDLGKSKFSGSLPSELEALTNLYYLDLQGNPLLTGTLPFMNFSKSSRYASLKINNTGLTGTLPEDACGAWFLWFDCPKVCGCGCPCT